MIVSRSRWSTLVVAPLCALFVGACDDGPTPPPDGPAVDAMVDARPELDGAPDATPDGMIGPDAAPDADLDAATLVDALPDAVVDALPDRAIDALPDAERRDVGSPFRDAAPVDPVEPCTLFPCACEPGEEAPCYPGPAETEGVGICVGGVRTCAEDGSGFGACVGARGPLGEDCRTAEDEDCDGATPPCGDAWLYTYADGANQAVRSVAVTPDGDVLVLLDFDQTVQLGGGRITARRGSTDLGLARYDRQGNPVWSRSWGDASDEFAGQLALGPAGEVAVLFRLYGALRLDDDFMDSDGLDDIGLLLLEPDGRQRWARRLGGIERDGSERVVFDGAGRVVLTGRFSGQVRFGARVLQSAGATDAFVARFAAEDGVIELARQAGGVGRDGGRGIAVGADGTLYVGGRFEQIASWGGAPIESTGAGDVYITALEADGAHRWTRHLSGPGDDGLYDLLLDPESGALYAFGFFGETLDYGGAAPLQSDGAPDFFVLRIDPDGAATAVAFGEGGDQTETPFVESSYGALALGPDGLYLAGPFGGSAFGLQAMGGVDGFVARIDRDMVLQAALGFGTGFSEMALDVAVDPADGAVVLGGRYYSREGPTIGPFGPLVGAANSDGFVVRLTELPPSAR